MRCVWHAPRCQNIERYRLHGVTCQTCQNLFDLMDKSNRSRTFVEVAFSNATGAALENAASSLMRVLHDFSISSAKWC